MPNRTNVTRARTKNVLIAHTSGISNPPQVLALAGRCLRLWALGIWYRCGHPKALPRTSTPASINAPQFVGGAAGSARWPCVRGFRPPLQCPVSRGGNFGSSCVSSGNGFIILPPRGYSPRLELASVAASLSCQPKSPQVFMRSKVISVSIRLTRSATTSGSRASSFSAHHSRKISCAIFRGVLVGNQRSYFASRAWRAIIAATGPLLPAPWHSRIICSSAARIRTR